MDNMRPWAQQGGWPHTGKTLILLIRLLHCSLTLLEDTLHSSSSSLPPRRPVFLLLLVVLAGWGNMVEHGHFLLEGNREMQSAIQSWPLCSSADELCRVDNGLNYLSPSPSSPALIVASPLCCCSSTQTEVEGLDHSPPFTDLIFLISAWMQSRLYSPRLGAAARGQMHSTRWAWEPVSVQLGAKKPVLGLCVSIPPPSELLTNTIFMTT